jgi:hypothetical protein
MHFIVLPLLLWCRLVRVIEPQIKLTINFNTRVHADSLYICIVLVELQHTPVDTTHEYHFTYITDITIFIYRGVYTCTCTSNTIDVGF